MSKPKKIAFHVRQTAQSLGLSTINDENVQKVFDILLTTYQEYNLESKIKLKSEIQVALNEYIASIQKPTTASAESSTVLSLNQTLRNNYSSTASKRQIPVDPSEIKEVSQQSNTIISEGGSSSNDDKIGSNVAEVAKVDNSATAAEKTIKVLKRSKSSTMMTSNENASQSFSTFFTSSIACPRPSNRLRDFAGLDSVVRQIKELVFFPVLYPEIYAHLGVQPAISLLLQGPTGCGKTSLALAIAGELDLPFFKVSGPELIGGTSGESEERVRESFKAAAAAAPSILFLDSLDVLASKKDSAQRGMDRRVIAQLCDSIDSITNLSEEPSSGSEQPDKQNASSKAHKFVVLISATNKADVLEPSVRGRFNKELSLPVPDAPSRTHILRLMAAKLRLANDVNFEEVGRATPGFVGADLRALVTEAGMAAVARIIAELGLESEEGSAKLDEIKKYIFGVTTATNAAAESEMEVVVPSESLTLYVQMKDFITATKSIQPSAKREGFAVVPDVTWDDVGALVEVREELFNNVLEPIAHPERFRSLGLETPAGVLFFGPPGCGKTLLAKAVANQSGANFISVKGPELLNMYVGESESRVRQVFARARSSTPCVIFFDELDALCPKRGSGAEGGNGVSERVVNQLLTELDGLETRKDVYIIAATNRLELIDDAMLRPGRIGKLLYVPLPTPTDRVGILQALVRKVSINAHEVDIAKVATDLRAEGYSGADLSALVREAGLCVMREWKKNSKEASQVTLTNSSSSSISNGVSLDMPTVICQRHFEAALGIVKPSVTREDRERFERVQQLLRQGLGALQALKAARDLFTGRGHSSSRTRTSGGVGVNSMASLKRLRDDDSDYDDEEERYEDIGAAALLSLDKISSSPNAAVPTTGSRSKRSSTDRSKGEKNFADCILITPEQRLGTYPVLLSHSFTARSGVLWCQCCAVEVGSKLSRIQDHVGVDKNWLPVVMENNHLRRLHAFQRQLPASVSTTESGDTNQVDITHFLNEE